MKLHEITVPNFLTDEEDIEAFLQNRFVKAYTIDQYGVVDAHQFVNLSPRISKLGNVDRTMTIDKQLPIRFSVINGNFNCSQNNLTSLEGFPTFVKGYMRISGNENLKDFKGLKEARINGNLYLESTGITSLVGIADAFSQIDGNIYADWNLITEGGLGIVQIKGLKRLIKGGMSQMTKPFRIIEKYLGTDNIIECQSELIEAGYEDYAVL